MAPKHSRAELGAGVGVDKGWPVPGGIGYGYSFNTTSLLWEDSTTIEFSVVTPDTVGPGRTYYLYLTTTNRSQLGMEAFISYAFNNEARFRVYDWARTDRWQTAMNLLADYPEYLAVRPDEYGTPRQMCRIRNSTIYLGPGDLGFRWRNEALLFNYVLGVWDLVYSYEYSTATKEENTFESGDTKGWWGPIVEVWMEEESYDNIPEVGFDRTCLYQDGATEPHWLTAADCGRPSMPTFHMLTEMLCRGFVVYTTPVDPDGDGQDRTEEAEAGTDSTVADSLFRVMQMAGYPATNEVGATVESALGREYRLFAAPSVTGPWAGIGAGLQGTGGPLELLTSTAIAARQFYQVRCRYDMGSACVRTNTPQATFTLAPTAGPAHADWGPLIGGNRWDKYIASIPVGTYVLSFNPVAGMTAPADQSVTITRGGLTVVEGMYAAE